MNITVAVFKKAKIHIILSKFSWISYNDWLIQQVTEGIMVSYLEWLLLVEFPFLLFNRLLLKSALLIPMST